MSMWSFQPETWAEFQRRIEVGTGGRLKIEIYYLGEHPYKSPETLRSIQDDAADMTTACHKQAGDEPRLAVSTAMPFLVPRGDFKLDKMITKKMAEETIFLDIFRDWNGEYLTSYYTGGQHLYMKNTLVRSPEDLKNRKVRVAHFAAESTIEAMGGVPIRVAWAETYTALATGLVEGVQTSFVAARGQGFIELCPYITWLCMNYSPYRLVANKKSLEALPADVREDLLRTIKELEDWWMSGSVMESLIQLEDSFFVEGTTATTIPLDWREELRAGAFERTWKPILDDAGPEGWEMFDMIAKILIAEGYEVPGYTPK